MKTRLTSLLGNKITNNPGGMAWTSDANLAAADFQRGGAGIISAGGVPADGCARK